MNGLVDRTTWLFLVLLGGMVGVYVLGAYLPAQSKIHRLHADVAMMQQQTIQIQQTVARLGNVQDRIRATTEYHEQWQRRLPPIQHLPVVFGQIHQQISSAGATLTRFAPGTPQARERLQQVPIDLDCKVHFDQLHALVEALERLPQLVWIQSFQVTPADRDELNCKLNLVVFADQPENSG